MTAEQMRTVLETRLPEIERRIAWMAERELGESGSGRGPDYQRRLIREIRAGVADLRAALELPPAAEPVFDESLFQ